MPAVTDQTMRLQLPTDRKVLEELREGRNLAANISDAIGRHRKTVTRRLNQLLDYGLVKNVGKGLYEITARGVATLELMGRYDEFDHGEPDERAAFEQLVDDRAEDLEVRQVCVIDHAADE